MTNAAGENVFVQRLVDLRHFYAASSITARFVAPDLIGEPEDLRPNNGTAFIVRPTSTTTYFVTSRHILD